ncbi:ferritin-like domain-containing protein [Mumia sp. zg.B17]|uniref:ferritin-like fold-containing protein n=1 Tax=Mumia sp. zg.B17 TaxID=2855446 RepID=UPI001C6E1C74|nr:ferritin-like fold-containing protein [Mumia sp. zg.B17]MBW9206732.1 ferritin-like domain-containing protein [Mumia sp. zg.B17]
MADSTTPSETSAAFDDPIYREGVVELLGVIAYGELSAFERLAEDATLAPTLRDKAELAQMANVELGHFLGLRDRLAALGVDPYEAMTPFEETFTRFHAKTAPSDWFEGLVKAYVGDGLAADFYREIAAYLDVDTRALVLNSLAGTGDSDFVVARVREAIAADPSISGRLALWGRRLMGEALSQAQLVAAEHDGLTAVLVGAYDRGNGMDLAAIGRMFARMTENHAARMAELGLDS